MPRKLLVFGVIAVLGSMLVLWLVTRDNASSAGAPDPVATDDHAVVVADHRADPDRPALPADPNRPTSPSVAGVDRGTHEATPSADEYTINGQRIRDHRAPGDRKPMEVPPSIHPPGGRKIRPELTGLLTDQILAGMRECGRVVPKAALGDKPRLEGQIVIAIKGGQAIVTGSTVQLRNVIGDETIASAKQCIEQKALAVRAPATDEQDLDSYSISLSFAFP